MGDRDDEWGRKGATLSDNTAHKEFRLTRDEIVAAIRGGKLHYRPGSIFGNPILRLLRREVEALVKKRHGSTYLADQKNKNELERIQRELKRLKREVVALEARKAELLARGGR
ncbi:MAG: hypothetical protein HYZ53_30250 [Planctomycetes bacterium]|nr:hypothetical protein [Planctomycetota bacterium]